MWLSNLQEDQLIGVLRVPYPEWHKSAFIFSFVTFWGINSTFFLVETEQTALVSITGLIVVAALFALLTLFHLCGMRRRINTQQIQIAPIDELQSTPLQRSYGIKSPIYSLVSQRSQPRLPPQTSRYQLKYMAWLSLFTLLMIAHAVLFITQANNLVAIDPVVSLHIIVLIKLFSSTLVNAYTVIVIANLEINLLLHKSTFANYYEKFAFTAAFWNYLSNFFEIYFLTFNVSLILSSIIGLFIVGDLISTVLFYIYLCINIISTLALSLLYLLVLLLQKIRLTLNEI